MYDLEAAGEFPELRLEMRHGFPPTFKTTTIHNTHVHVTVTLHSFSSMKKQKCF